MKYYTESVSQDIIDKLNKKGIKNIKTTKKNTIVDISSIQYESDSAYMTRLLDMCHELSGVKQKVIYIPVSKWYKKERNRFEKSKTPVGAICRYMKQTPKDFKSKFDGYVFIFYNENKESFALYPDQYKSSEFDKFCNLLGTLVTSAVQPIKEPKGQKHPVKDIANIESKENKQRELQDKKDKLATAIASVASQAETEEEAWEMMDEDDEIKELIAQLEEEDDGKPKFNVARTSRITQLNDDFLNKNIKGKSIKEIIEKKEETIPPAHLKVSSINEEWDDVRFTNFQEIYDINSDIFNILKSFSDKSYPVSILDINIQDTSNNMDYIDTYTVNMEDGFGKRFTLTFDIPKFKNNRFMRLRGNEKVMSGQLVLLPCLKTDEDTVQCVSNYNKIFIRRYGIQGRSFPAVNRMMKVFTKHEINGIKVFFGDNSTICKKYELPVDYIDMASSLNRIETKETIYYFNQDEYYENYDIKSSDGMPYGIDKINGSLKFYKGGDTTISEVICNELQINNVEFADLYNSIKSAPKLSYSQVSVLANKIPLIVLMGYSLGLTKVLNQYAKDAEITNTKPDKNKLYIKFEDGYLVYPANYSSALLLNGLAQCPTESYSITDIDKRSTWLDFLEDFGGRILADGLDNFEDLFMDPITKEVCEHIKIPSNYFDLLMYANNLLADNKYNRHTDITGNRYRSNELVAGYFYKVISRSYVEYKSQVKRGRKVGMAVKRSAVIDEIFKDPVSSDLSILNPLLEIEAANSVSFKGLSGMNQDRSYGLDKRTYDDSMVNKLALSTGFSANVGISRQTTIDMDIDGKRGYIKQSNNDDNMSVTKTFGMTEALTPFGTTRDDPFRSAMTFIQTSKHSMRTKTSAPLLITNGADEAVPHIVSDTFAFKAKEAGEVIELTDEEIIIKYNNSVYTSDNTPYVTEIVSLKEEVKKNSDGGFYITLKLDTDLKLGDKFKKGDIIAYDKTSFSSEYGEDENLSYNLGVLTKVAILNTDEGFEDSTSISEWLSDAMETAVVIQDDKDISKNTNVYHMVKVGQQIQEGEPLIIFQNSFDEKDANLLLKNITDPEFVSDLGRVRLKSKYTGVVQDIKIYRTCEIEEMSESLQKIVTDYEKKIKAKKKLYQKYKTPGDNLLDPDYKLPPTGIMKNNQDGVKIVFYIRYDDKLSVGDKIVAQSANKGVVKNIFPEGLEPFSEYRPNENIHALFAARSFNARMVTSVWTAGAINKCMIELDRAVKDIMGLDQIPLDE